MDALSNPKPGAAHQTHPQRSALNRMRAAATGLLAVMLLLFLLTSWLKTLYPWAAYPRAFAEAALVGGCADWFAIVALFRHPLGLPIPHTAIIPRRKDQIGSAIGRFIANNFLSPAEISRQVAGMDVARWLANWLRDPENVSLLATQSSKYWPPLRALFGESQVRDMSRTIIQRGVDAFQAAPIAVKILSALLSQGRFDEGFNLAVDASSRLLELHRSGIKDRVINRNPRWYGRWIDVRVADALLNELLSALSAAREDLQHPWRLEGRKAVDRLIARLSDDPSFIAVVERVKTQVLRGTVVDGFLEHIGGEIDARLGDQSGAPNSWISTNVRQGLTALSGWLDHDHRTRALINDWSHRLIITLLTASRQEVGNFAASVVARWDAATLVQRVELEFGRDLQFIRVNGTLVGGLVGLIIFTLSQFIR